MLRGGERAMFAIALVAIALVVAVAWGASWLLA
jgi:hypothetical protein